MSDLFVCCRSLQLRIIERKDSLECCRHHGPGWDLKPCNLAGIALEENGRRAYCLYQPRAGMQLVILYSSCEFIDAQGDLGDGMSFRCNLLGVDNFVPICLM